MGSNPYYTGTQDEALKSRKANRKYFFLDGKLYKQLRFDNGHDSMVAWCYDDANTVELSLSYVKRKRKPSYTITQAAAMLNRSRMMINHLILFGVIESPRRSYPMNNKIKQDSGTFRMTDKDIYTLHEYFSNSRRIGAITRSAKPLPSKRELANLLKYEKISYLRTKDGVFVPTWQAPDIDDWL